MELTRLKGRWIRKGSERSCVRLENKETRDMVKMRCFTAILAVVVVLGLLTGCSYNKTNDAQIYVETSSVSSSTSEETVSVRFLGYRADAMNLVAIENAIHEFMEENPDIEIMYEGIKGEPYIDAFRLRAESNNLDDLFMIFHDQFLTLAPQGKLADLSDLSTIDGYSSLAKTQFIESDGKVYNLPTSIAAFGMYVNLDMLKENGFEVPTNWTEFSEQCDYFKSKGITPIIGNNYTTLYTLMEAKGLYPIYQREDSAQLIEAFNSGEADLVEYLDDGVELVGIMLEKGWFDVDELKSTNQTSDDLALFAQGNRPFMITGGWASQRLLKLEPNFEFAVYPYPVLEDASILVLNVATCLSVNAESDCVDEAKKFLEYLTQPDVIYEYCDTQSIYSPLADDRLPSDETVAPSARHLSTGPNVIGSDFRLKLPIDNATKAVGEAMLDGMHTEDAIKLLRELFAQ